MSYPFHCPTCGRSGTEDDGCVEGGECPDEDCDGTIVATGRADVYADTRERIIGMTNEDAVKAMTDSWFWDNEGPGFSCQEAEALASLVYRAGGDIDLIVDRVILGHGQPGRSEDEGDAHWWEGRNDT